MADKLAKHGSRFHLRFGRTLLPHFVILVSFMITEGSPLIESVSCLSSFLE